MSIPAEPRSTVEGYSHSPAVGTARALGIKPVLGLNRPVPEARIAFLERSMRNHGFLPFPIVVKKTGFLENGLSVAEIQDGQGRWLAAERAGVEPLFILTDKTVMAFRQAGRYPQAWTTADCIQYEALCDNPSAVIIMRLIDEFDARPTAVAYALGKCLHPDKPLPKISAQEFEAARRLLLRAGKFLPFAARGRIYCQATLLAAYIAIQRLPNYNEARFWERIQSYAASRLLNSHTKADQLQNLINVYNLRTQTRHCISMPPVRKK